MKRSTNPHVALGEAISGLRVLGIVFVGLWALIALMTTNGIHRLPSTNPQLSVFASATILLLSPGAIYLVAAVLVKRREEKAARLAQRTAIAQIAIVPIGLFIAIFARSLKLDPIIGPPAAAPAIVTAFFVPALLAQCSAINKARRAIAMLPTTRIGFEAIPMAALAETPIHPSESVREK